MKIVADTNVFLAVALNEPERSAIIARTVGHELIAPAILPFEIGNALSALVKRKRMSRDEALAAWAVCRSIPVDLKPVDIEDALLAAANHGIYAYDAYFLECAAGFRCPLLTLDRHLRTVGVKIGIKILEV
ncbi:MAG: type II toxin-antitoxin system VapC family toxin [Thermodesulfobacteriota bacterium]